MAKQRLRVIDTHQNIYQEGSSIDSFVKHQRLRGGLSDGIDVVHVDNGRLNLSVLATRGMGVWKGEVNGVPLGWDSPVKQPVHPAFVDPSRRGGIGWLDGFNELICRCGLAWHGAPGNDVISDDNGNVVSEQFLPLHGQVANLPAHFVEAAVCDDGLIEVTGKVEEASMFGGRLELTSTLSTEKNSSSFRIVDQVRNLSSGPAEVEMLYHCNIGRPFLDAGATLLAAAKAMAPRDAWAAEGVESWSVLEAPTPGFAEQVYFFQPVADSSGRGLAALVSHDHSVAFAVRFDLSTLPWFVVWKNTQAEEDGYVTGLEPGSSFPNLRSFERDKGRVVSLGAGESTEFSLEFEVATSSESVQGLVDEVSAIQGTTNMDISMESNPDWSPS